jgi:hypothetical protein
MPKPTPTPTATDLLIPPPRLVGAFPFCDSPLLIGDGGAVYLLGLPDIAWMVWAAIPNSLRACILWNVDCGKVAVTPEGTTVVQYLIYVACVVVCIEAGQFATAVRQLVSIVVNLVLSVVVVRSCRLSIRAVRLACISDGFLECTHTCATVVVKMAVDVSMIGPYV